MDTEVWGPAAWLLIHSAALAYSEENPTVKVRNNYRKFFESLVDVLPCVYCRKHYTERFDMTSLNNALDSRVKLFRWTVDLHNEVNKSIGKPTYSYLEALKSLQEKYDKPSGFRALKVPEMMYLIPMLLILSGVFVFIVCKYRRR